MTSTQFADISGDVLAADRYDAPKAREYEELMDIINRRGRNGDEVYTNLMNKEERVLNTVDRVVNDARLQKIHRRSFLNMSLMEVASRTVDVVREIFHEMFVVESAREFTNAFTRIDRRPYLGVVLIIIAAIIMFVEAST